MKNRSRIVSTCSRRIKALADPIRLNAALALLSGPATVSQLLKKVRVEQSLLSHHLQILRKSGVALSMRKGREMEYRLAADIHGSNSSHTIHLGCCRLTF